MLKNKTSGKLPETHDGRMPGCKIIYNQCKAVIRGPHDGGITPFSVGKINFSNKRAKAFVKGVDSKGYDYIRRNYPTLCESAL